MRRQVTSHAKVRLIITTPPGAAVIAIVESP